MLKEVAYLVVGAAGTVGLAVAAVWLDEALRSTRRRRRRRRGSATGRQAAALGAADGRRVAREERHVVGEA